MKNVYIDFKYDGQKQVKCKPIVLPVVVEYIGGAVQVPSGDVYQTKPGKDTTYIATK